ncbi:hypothetical protein [Nocardioides luteus]|uniref:hypothetical protein n=1 Tax=Nocardioides luteus TaxID=1844 RepID=UPI0018C8D918|nr:hypothetical protein [Nocardioides luteus]MBG6098547.1 pyruvate/2-oxoglutarate dehydrogenase complex dihydrolipoamide acyltransferase (E2) component [Nocardioides luteus]
MSDKSTGDQAPEPVEPTVEQPPAEQPAAEQPAAEQPPAAQPAPVAYAPPAYGPPTAAPVAAPAPRKKLSDRVFGWKSVAAAAAAGLVLGGGVATGVVAAVVDGGSDRGPRELGQMRGGGEMPYGQPPDFGQDGRGPGGFGPPQDQFGRSFPGQSS